MLYYETYLFEGLPRKLESRVVKKLLFAELESRKNSKQLKKNYVTTFEGDCCKKMNYIELCTLH